MMHQGNPFAPPGAATELAPGDANTDIQLVLRGQKKVLYAILINLISIPARLALGPAVGYLALVAMVLSFVGVYQLGMGFRYSTIARVVFIVLMIVPLVNLIALVVLNSKATRALTAAGYKVGLLGAST